MFLCIFSVWKLFTCVEPAHNVKLIARIREVCFSVEASTACVLLTFNLDLMVFATNVEFCEPAFSRSRTDESFRKQRAIPVLAFRINSVGFHWALETSFGRSRKTIQKDNTRRNSTLPA